MSILALQLELGASTLVIHLSFPSDFRDKLWVGLGLGVGIGLGLYFWTIMLIQEHVLLGK